MKRYTMSFVVDRRLRNNAIAFFKLLHSGALSFSDPLLGRRFAGDDSEGVAERSTTSDCRLGEEAEDLPGEDIVMNAVLVSRSLLSKSYLTPQIHQSGSCRNK